MDNLLKKRGLNPKQIRIIGKLTDAVENRDYTLTIRGASDGVNIDFSADSPNDIFGDELKNYLKKRGIINGKTTSEPLNPG